MSEFVFWVLFLGLMFVALGILAFVERRIEESKKHPKMYFSILLDNKFYNIPSGYSEEACKNVLGVPDETDRKDGMTLLYYHEKVGSSGYKHTVKIYFKDNKIVNFATYRNGK